VINPCTPIEWLERPVELWPGRCRVLVHGVGSEMPETLRNYWLELGREKETT
jgi:hypothetical protein